MLQLRPNCEYCDKDLPAHSTEACICSYECTFCRHCVETVLENVCPNCGGGFSPRPIRPQKARREGVSLHLQPASKQRVNRSLSEDEVRSFCQAISGIKPENR